MSGGIREEIFEPRRLRDSTARPRSVEGRLARQLRTLSAYAPMRQLRRYSGLPRGRRYRIAVARIVVAALLVLAVSGVAAAMAGYVTRQVRSSPAGVKMADLPAATPRTKARPKNVGRPSAEPATPLAQAPQVEAPAPIPSQPSEAAALAVSAAGQKSGQALGDEAIGRRVPAKSQSSAAERLAGAAPGRPPSEDLRERTPTVAPLVSPSIELPPSGDPPSPPLAPRFVPGPAPSKAASGKDGHAFAHPRTDVVAQEAALLRQTLSVLRRDHDPRGALRLLDEYDRQFGQGMLAAEAASTRAQALLLLGDHARALELLDRLPLSHETSTGELRVTRGELRSVAGRCREALLDFDAVLGASSGSAPNEIARALFGRASCRARLKDLAGAEADRRRYLKEYPDGPAAGRLLSGP